MFRVILSLIMAPLHKICVWTQIRWKSNANWVLTNQNRALRICVWFFWLASSNANLCNGEYIMKISRQHHLNIEGKNRPDGIPLDLTKLCTVLKIYIQIASIFVSILIIGNVPIWVFLGKLQVQISTFRMERVVESIMKIRPPPPSTFREIISWIIKFRAAMLSWLFWLKFCATCGSYVQDISGVPFESYATLCNRASGQQFENFLDLRRKDMREWLNVPKLHIAALNCSICLHYS